MAYHGNRTLVRPIELTLYQHLGDNRMLAAGGLLNQPVALWFNVQYAGWVWEFLRKVERIGQGKAEYGEITEDERPTYEEILKLQGLLPSA